MDNKLKNNMDNLDVCKDIMAEIFDEFGCGFEEKVYQEAFEYSLEDRHIFKHRPFVILQWKGRDLSYMQIDIEAGLNDKVIVEIKAMSKKLNKKDRLQVEHYMKARGVSKGLLVNFGRLNTNNPNEPDYQVLSS